MALKINGLDGTFQVPRVLKNYVFARFDARMTATMSTGLENTVDIKPLLTKAWAGVAQRSNQRPCNDYFKSLFRQKSLLEILNEGDIVIHRLEPKTGYDYSTLPDANTAGRDIGIDPQLLFDPDPAALVCTLIHELAHVGGASTNAAGPQEQAHAAEKALVSCGCRRQYRKEVLGSIQTIRSGRYGYA